MADHAALVNEAVVKLAEWHGLCPAEHLWDDVVVVVGGLATLEACRFHAT